MIKALRFLLPIFILTVGAVICYLFISSKPDPKQRHFPIRTPEVRGIIPKETTYDVKLESQGVVQARTQINLVSEVRGRIVEISPSFREGAFFEKGDILLRLDPLDYESELVIAEGALAQTELILAQEEARYEQAKLDWKRLGVEDEPSGLALREPQIKQARANVASSEARVRTAKRNLDRTTISAPFAGRILEKRVDVGQYVNTGAVLASIYAVDFAEVRLPINERQLAFLYLKDAYRGEDPEMKNGPKVELKYEQGNETFQWVGRIVRAEGSIDLNSRQLFVIAQIADPYGKREGETPPLKVGTFVQASIAGRVLEHIFIFPRSLLKETNFVLVIDSEGLLHRRKVNIVWMSDDDVIVDGGFFPGDRICITHVPYSLEGLEVKVVEVDSFEEELIPDSEKTAGKPVARRPSGKGGMLIKMLDQLPKDKPLPEKLKKKLEKAAVSGDRKQMKPAMDALKKWAKTEGIELNFPQGGR